MQSYDDWLRGFADHGMVLFQIMRREDIECDGLIASGIRDGDLHPSRFRPLSEAVPTLRMPRHPSKPEPRR